MRVLIWTSLIDCVVVSLLATVRRPEHMTRMCVLLLLQFTSWAFYSPARAALLPVVVRPSDLPAATLLDSFSWSLTGAIASSLGGVVASKLGIQACFLLVGCRPGRGRTWRLDVSACIGFAREGGARDGVGWSRVQGAPGRAGDPPQGPPF